MFVNNTEDMEEILRETKSGKSIRQGNTFLLKGNVKGLEIG